jgi:PadR family transcriptional regulator PadR
MSKRGRRRRRKRFKNFWSEWDEERKRRWEAHGDGPAPKRPSRAEMKAAWREYFQEFAGEMPEHHWAFGGRRFTPWHQGDVEFNPFVAHLFSQRGGLLPLIVLQLLIEKPRYGNEIMSLISEKTSGRWNANPGAIYPLMTTLEERGLVEGQWEDPVKRTVRVYKITDLGKKEFERVKAIVRPKLEEAAEVFQAIVNDLENEDTGEGESYI